MAISLKMPNMGAPRIRERTCAGLKRRLLVTAACGFSVLVLSDSASAQTIGSGQTVNVSTLGSSSTPNFQGGTLEVDKTGTYPNNFVLGAATTSQVANMIDAHGNQGTFSGIGADAVTGVAGNLTIEDTVGGGIVTFTGVNTYTGPTTVNSGATLALSGSGSISLSQYVLNNGTLDISGAASAAQILSLAGAGNVVLGGQTLTITDAGVNGNNVFTGTISGSGSLSITGGVEIIDGASTYTGGTTITSGGAMQIGNDDTAGSVIGNISNAGNLTFNRTDAITFSGTISGAGGVNQTNGSVTFTSAQPYTGFTNITAGTLFLSGSGSIASSGTLTDNGTFDISQTNSGAAIKQITGTGNVVLGSQTLTITTSSGSSAIFSGVISGTGGLVLSGGGTEVLSGTNTYTGGTTVTGAMLQIGGGSTTGTVIGNITDNGTVAFDYANAQVFSNIISGTGAVQLINGTLDISSVQTYTGLTTITAGTLVLTPGSDISTSKGVVANGTLDISGTSGATIASLSGQGIVQLGGQTLTIANAGGTFSGVIEGSGGVTINGGTQTLSGTSNYTGTTTINSGATLALTSLNSLATSAIVDNANGTLDISGATNNLSNVVTVNVAALSGSGAVTLGANTLAIANAAGTFSGAISGTGNLTIGGGTQTLTGANSFSGTTIIASGATLVLSGNGTLPASTVTANGTLDISAASGSATFVSLSGTGAVILGANNITLANAGDDFGGAISGTGGLTVSGGTQTLSGTNTYTGGTAIASGATLQMGDGTTNGTIVGNIANAGTLAFDYSGSATFSGTITGTGGVNQLGGTTILTAANTYTGGTAIASGATLQVGNGATLGSIAGDVADNGTLAFNRSDTVNFSGAISGRGGVSQIGSGVLILSGTNTYTGATTIASGGTLQLAGGNSLATSSDVADNGRFDVSAAATPRISSLSGSGAVSLGAQTLTITNGSGSFSGIISGTGGITVSGGTQTLAGSSTYSGATVINGGTLAVTGSISNSSGIAVNSGGTLSGNGTVSSVAVASGGTIAPGSGGSGTLNVGSVSFASGSNFLINTSSTSYSSLAASASASLGGTISVASTNGTYLLGQKMTVLTAAGGVNGSFTAGSVPNGASGAQYASLVSQDANDVYLTVNLSKLSPALPSGSTLNQTNAVAGIDAGIAHGDSLRQALENLGNVSSSTLATDAQQMAGELGADIAQVGNTMFNPFQNAVFDHLADIGNQIRGPRRAALTSGPQAWFAVLAGSNIVGQDAAAGAQKFSSSAVGVAGGADWHLSPDITLGGALSLGSTHFHVGGGLGQGKATAYQLGIYGLIQYTPRIYGSFLGAFGSDSIKTTRTVTATETDMLSASPTSKIFDARYETGINLNWIKPYLAIEDRLAQASAYTETGPSGADSFALNYGSHTVNMPDVEIGFRNAGDLPVARNWVLHLTDGFAFEHAANGAFETDAAYAALAGSSFTAYGAQPGKNVAKLSLGAEFKSRSGLTAGLNFDDAVSSRSQSYNGVFSLGYGW